MGGFLPLVVRRILTYGALLLPVLIGTTVAAATTASIVIYTDALRDLGLDHALNNADERALDLQVNFHSAGLDSATYQGVTSRVDDRIRGSLAALAEQDVEHVRSSTFLVAEPGGEPDLEVTPRAAFHVLTDPEKLLVVTGRMPESGAVASPDGTLTVEAVAMKQGADYLGLSIGDTVSFVPFWEDRTAVVDVVLTGMAVPVDRDAYQWEAPSMERMVREPTLFNTLPVIVTGSTLVGTLGAAFLEMDGTYYSRYALNPGRIRATETQAVQSAIAGVASVLGSTVPSYRQKTALSQLLATYDTRIRFIQVPLAVMLLLVTAMVLYSIIFLAGLVTQRQRADATLLRSRGAKTPQIFLIYASQGLLISGLAIAAAPFFAAGLVASMGLLPVFGGLGDGGLLTVTISPTAFAFAAVGGVLAFVVLLVPTAQIARENLLDERRRTVRPPRSGVVQRYYLDIGLAGATALFLWQLGQQGSLVADTLSGQQGADLFLLLIPTMFLAATGLLLLRVLPVISGVLARIATPVAPTWLALGLWQLGRNPLSATRLVLLLVLAAGLGAFAASFGGTLDRSYQERALYQAGSDVRVPDADLARNGPSESLQARAERADGIQAASLVLRQTGSFVSGNTTDRYELLAVDPETFGEVAWWRGDFANDSLPSLLSRLEVEPETPWGIRLPDDADSIGVWIRSAEPNAISQVGALVADANGRYFTVYLGNLENTEWTMMESRLQPTRRFRFRRAQPTLEPAGPFTFISLQVVQRSRSTGMTSGAFFLDELITRGPGEGAAVQSVRSFDSVDNLAVINVGPLTRTDSLRVIPGAGRDGSDATLFSWGAISGFVQRGFYAGPESYELPIVVSPAVLRTTAQGVGDPVVLGTGSTRIDARIVGVADFFPTLNPTQGAGFILMGLNGLLRQQNLVGQGAEIQPAEVWYTLEDGLAAVQRDATLERIKEATGSTRPVVRNSILETSRADPLVAAGWGALLLVAYGAVLFLGATGFIAHSVLTVGERGRQFALLRTLGLGGAQIQAIVWFEHMTVVAIGMGAGYLLGQRTGALLMPFLDRTEDGIAVLPPYILETNLLSVGAVYLVMAAIFVAATLIVVRMYNRLALGQILRIGED